jgi:hypothetical protein
MFDVINLIVPLGSSKYSLVGSLSLMNLILIMSLVCYNLNLFVSVVQFGSKEFIFKDSRSLCPIIINFALVICDEIKFYYLEFTYLIVYPKKSMDLYQTISFPWVCFHTIAELLYICQQHRWLQNGNSQFFCAFIELFVSVLLWESF